MDLGCAQCQNYPYGTQVAHPHLPLRRYAPPRHVRPETGRAHKKIFGEFKPTDTTVNGVQIGESFDQLDLTHRSVQWWSADKSEEHVELLQVDKSGMRVASYLMDLPPRPTLQRRLHEAVVAARARLESGAGFARPCCPFIDHPAGARWSMKGQCEPVMLANGSELVYPAGVIHQRHSDMHHAPPHNPSLMQIAAQAQNLAANAKQERMAMMFQTVSMVSVAVMGVVQAAQLLRDWNRDERERKQGRGRG